MKYILSLCLGFLLTADFITAPIHAAVFDVKTFGAVGDGKAVDTAAINKAIDAAHAAGGGTDEMRPPIMLNDVNGADFDHVKARRTPNVPFFVLHNVSEFALHNCPGLTDTNRATVEHGSF